MAVSLRQPLGRQPPASGGLWDDVLELTKLAQAKNSDPLLWAMHINSTLTYAGAALPSTELADLLVSHICWGNHVPITWKYLEQALAIKLAPPLLVLALLSSRVIPRRQLHSAAYRLYIELLKRHVLLLSSQTNELIDQSIMTSIDDVLHLSQIFGVQSCEPGVLLVEFLFSIVWQLLDASLDDEGLMDPTGEYKSRWQILAQDMDVDGQDLVIEKRTERSETLHKENITLAIEMIGEFLQNKKTSRILFLARRNMPSHWAGFIEGLRLLSAKSAVLRNSKLVTPDVLLYLTSDKCENVSGKVKVNSRPDSHAVMASSSQFSSAGQSVGASWSSLWIPIDLFLEDAMDGSKVAASSAVEHLASLVKALQAVHGTSWHDAFLGLWIASLRLVQRERDPSEGPVPRLDTCLCMLLSITTLAITSIIEEEECELMEEAGGSPSNRKKDDKELGNRRNDLITSLQQLGNYDALLSPPQSVCSAANQAAAKAIMFVSGLGVNNGYYKCVSVSDMPINCSGNMWHLIVEACIARNLLDTSAYFWPGYVNVRISQMPHGVPNPSGWSSLMKGSPLTPSMVNALVATPASSLAELEKIYEIASNGSNEEKISAATILCGASIIRGWNVQEHTILFIARLLSPAAPADNSDSDSYLVSCAPFLYVLLAGISSVDCVQIFSLHGLIPLLAGQLIPICEVFGSTAPNASWTLTMGDEISCHAVFSIAFMLLLRLWRFDHPPLENVKRDGPPMGLQLTPEFLLLVRNSQFATFGNLPKDRLKAGRLSKSLTFPMEPLFIDSFPKLKIWYQQHQQCIASILSGLVPGAPVHQIADALLTMMFRKINKPGQPLNSSSSGSSNLSGSATDDVNSKLRVPAWDILEATPFVLDAALTACAHGRLSPRELATGLKDLADFLPASLATIVSYFGAEVTRGVWKPAFMNGTDWPSPAANLSLIEQQIKKILAATGVDVPSLPVGGSSPATLPLPLAALISLTITYKLDKATERCLTLVGPSLNSLAASCPWPCTPIMASLWTQKVKRWSDFLVFSSSRTVFQRSNDALIQLLKSCFDSTLGLNTSHVHSKGGVGALLGHGFGSHFSGGISPVAPGILYLRVHRSVRDCLYIAEEIVSILMLSVRDISTGGLPKDRVERLKRKKSEMRYGEVSLASAMIWVKVAASLAASLVWISGGSALVLSLIKETLPSWFLSVENAEDDQGRDFGGMAATLGGYALAYFVVFCMTFSLGGDSDSPASKRRGKILGVHLDFMASALDGKITLGCSRATWRAYVSGFVRLVVDRPVLWLEEVELSVLKRLASGLRQLNEEALALSLLQKAGFAAMGAAAELIIVEGGF